jgi:hypothetical protein
MAQQGVLNTEYFSGQGVVMLGTRETDGSPAGLRPVGTVRDMTLNVTTTELTEKETQTGARGAELTLTTEVNVALSMTLKSLDKENLALATLGGNTDKIAGTVTDQSVKLTGELYMPLNFINVSAVVVTDSLGATTYVVETDYKVDEQSGLIQRVEGGAITTGDIVLVDFAYASQSVIEAQTSSQSPDRWVRFNGLNTANGDKPVVIDFFKVNTAPLSNLALITDDTAGLELSMSVLFDSLRPSAESNYYRIIKQ